MAKFKLDLSTNNILSCILYALIGLLLVILQGGSLGILMTIIGVLLIAYGLINIFKNKETLTGIIQIVFGIAIIVCGWLIASIVLLVFGIILVVFGASELIKNFKNGFMAILPFIIVIVIGALLIIAKWTLLDLFCLIAGIIFIINAVLVLFGNSFIKK